MDKMEELAPAALPEDESQKVVSNQHGVVLLPEIYDIINEMNITQDDIATVDFDAVAFINQEFPSEQSLVHLDPILTKLRIKIAQTDAEIAKQVRQLSGTGDKASADLDTAQESIKELFAKILEIQRKAEQSENMVKEICSGVKRLDCAKRNITNTITGLKRIHMLITGVNQLKEWTKRRQYRDVGKLLEAVNQLSTYFSEEKYKSMSRITDLTTAVEEIKVDLKNKVREEFFDNKDAPLSPVQLSDVCFVIDALGEDTKEQFIKTFCIQQMSEYARVFSEQDESSRLEFCDRRFLWINRKLRDYESKYEDVFPSSWHVAERICEYFGNRTSEHFTKILSKSLPDVKVLLHAIRETLKWEKEMCIHFAKEQPAVTMAPPPESKSPSASEVEAPAEDEEENPHSAAAIKARYRKFQQEREQEQQKGPKPEMKFHGIISTSFDNYMQIYINEEDSLMKAKFDSILAEETWEVEDDARNKVLRSSTDLIFYFKKSMKRCTELTTNEAFYKMYELFKKYLQAYAQRLSRNIPPIENDSIELTEKQERKICLIINTGEYCTTLCKQLASTVASSIDEQYQDKIDMKKEQQEFSAVFVPMLVQHIYKCRRISQSGAEQLLLDVAVMKGIIVEMPTLTNNRGAPSKNAPSRYSKYVTKEIAKAEKILKVINSFTEAYRGPKDVEIPANTFVQLLPKATEQLFSRLLDIKGINKSDQQVYIQAYRRAKMVDDELRKQASK